MSLIDPKQQGKFLFIFRPEDNQIIGEKYKVGEYDPGCDVEELMDDDENDVKGDEAENTVIYKARIFYMTHRESSTGFGTAYT